MLTKKMSEDAQKAAYIVYQYPEKNLDEVIACLAMPGVDINTALWAAQEAGYIAEPDLETGKMEFLKAPDDWDFGDEERELEARILYCFRELAKKERDLEENYLTDWCHGYPGHDIIVAMKRLVENRQLNHYDLTDPKDLKSTYTFYSLFENSENMWGREYFKEQPTGEEKAEDPDEPETPSEQ